MIKHTRRLKTFLIAYTAGAAEVIFIYLGIRIIPLIQSSSSGFDYFSNCFLLATFIFLVIAYPIMAWLEIERLAKKEEARVAQLKPPFPAG